jgi:hypothetical protein
MGSISSWYASNLLTRQESNSNDITGGGISHYA